MESSLDHHIATAAAAMASATTSLRSGAPVNEAIVAAARALVDQTDLLCTRMVAEFAGSTVIRENGYRNISEWLAHNSHARPTEGEQRVAHADVLAKLPGWSEAVDAGTIGDFPCCGDRVGNEQQTIAVAATRRRDAAWVRTNTVVRPVPHNREDMGLAV